ncbi:MAG: LamG-like jellyroll fold domain-containing protein, partial [Bacteroidota bacterium]
MGRRIHHKRYVGHVPICLLFLSLWLWGGNLQGQNLDCGNATAIDLCAFIEGNTSAGAANNDGYYRDPNSAVTVFASGKEIVYAISSSVQTLRINLQGDVTAAILGDCSNIRSQPGFDGFPLALPKPEGGVLFSGEFTVNVNDIPGVNNGIVYIVVEENNFQPNADYTLQVGDANDAPCPNPNDPCADPVALTIGDQYEGSTIDGTSVFTTYGNGKVLAGAEVVHRFEWPGGFMKATLSPGDILFGLELDLMLLGSCDPNDFIASEPRAGLNETITQNLPAGTYFLVVDGLGETDVDFYKLLVEQLPDPCDNLVPLTLGTPYTGTNANGTSVFTDYGDNIILDGPEVIHTVDWPGGPMQVSFTNEAPDLGGRLFLNVLNSCNPTDLARGAYEMGNVNERIIDDFPAGTYYLSVDGFNFTNNVNNYRLLVEEVNLSVDICEISNVIPPSNLACGRTIFGTTDRDSRLAVLDTHCGIEGYTGKENVFQVDWDGGRFLLRLEDKTPGQEMILYSSCDENSCVAISANQIDQNLEAGTYYVVIDGKNGVAGDYVLSLSNPNDPDCTLPDFNVLSLEGDDCATPGASFTVTARVENSGGRSFTSDELVVSVDRFFISDDPDPNNYDNWIRLAENPSQGVNPGESYTSSAKVTIPSDLQEGSYFMIFYAEDDLKVTESSVPDFRSNQFTYPISIGNNNGPDYVASNFQAPSAANPEEDIQIKVTLANEGNANGSASGGKDKIFLNTSNNLESGNPIELLPTTNLPTRDLSANQQLTITRTVQIPANTAAGDYFLIFHMDADNVVDECNDQNNTVSTAIKIRIGNPDYVPQDFVVDGKTELTVKQGQSLSGSVEIKNQGNGPGTRFTDGKYYYSTNASFNPNADILLGNNRDSIEPLGAGEKRTEGETVKLPNSVPTGPGYILYVVDVPNKVKESNEQNNVAFVRINVEARPNPGTGTGGSGFEANFTVDDTRPCKGTEVTFTPNVISRVLPDQGPNGLDGALRNFDLPSTAGPSGLGNAIDFDGTDDFVEIPDGLMQGVTNFTFESWFYHVEIQNFQRLMFFGTTSGPDGDSFLSFSPTLTGNPNIYLKKGDERVFVRAPDTLAINNWHHIAFTIDESGNELVATIYINGELVESRTIPFGISDLDLSTNLGLGNNPFGSSFLKGRLDEVRMWNTVRTAEQIADNYEKELNGTEDGLIAYYDMNQPLASGNASYNWSFPGGTPSSSTEAIPTVTYAQAGSYDVSLSITADGQSDTESKTEFMNVQSCDPNELDADFIVDNSNPCEGEEIMFTNTTTGLTQGPTDILADGSANGNNGTLQNFTDPFVDNPGYGKAIEFDGVDDFVDLPDGLTANLTTFTFETRYFHKSNEAWQRIMDFGNNTTQFMLLTPVAGFGGRNPFLQLRTPSTTLNLEASEALVLNRWYHIAVVLDGSSSSNNARMYIDGELKGQSTFPLSPQDLGNLSDNWLGRSQFSPDPYL